MTYKYSIYVSFPVKWMFTTSKFNKTRVVFSWNLRKPFSFFSNDLKRLKTAEKGIFWYIFLAQKWVTLAEDHPYEKSFDIYRKSRCQKTSHKLDLDTFWVSCGRSKFYEFLFVHMRAPSQCVRAPPSRRMCPLGIFAPALMSSLLLVFTLTWRTCGIRVGQGNY